MGFFMCVYVYVSMRVYACLCVSMRVYECLCVSMRVYACLCVSMRVYACTCSAPVSRIAACAAGAREPPEAKVYEELASEPPATPPPPPSHEDPSQRAARPTGRGRGARDPRPPRPLDRSPARPLALSDPVRQPETREPKDAQADLARLEEEEQQRIRMAQPPPGKHGMTQDRWIREMYSNGVFPRSHLLFFMRAALEFGAFVMPGVTSMGPSPRKQPPATPSPPPGRG